MRDSAARIAPVDSTAPQNAPYDLTAEDICTCLAPYNRLAAHPFFLAEGQGPPPRNLSAALAGKLALMGWHLHLNTFSSNKMAFVGGS